MSPTIRDYLSSEAMLSESGEDLLKSGMFSDVSVKCGDRVWNLHKAIICPRCPYFSKAFNSPFQEATTGELILQEQDPDGVDHIIHFLYTGKVLHGIVDSHYFGLFELADFFQISCLAKKIISMTGFKLDKMAARFRNIPQPYKGLQVEFDEEEIEYLFRVIETSYASDSPFYTSLRDLVKGFIVKSGFQITKDDRFLTALEGIPELALDIIKLLQHSAIVNDPPPRCHGCKCKISLGEPVDLWMGKGIKDGASVRYELRGICRGCQ
ncbi:POZ domain-containing protein [Daldinia grandis]|nr:POZ domain-containing protein [Daldinia grandis]